MTSFRRNLLSFIVTLGVWGSVESSKGAILIVIEESGSDLILTASGTANLAGLAEIGTSNGPAQLDPVGGLVLAGSPIAGNYKEYATGTGPFSFGGSTAGVADSGSGSHFGVHGEIGLIFLPAGYVSNTFLSATSTWNNQSFASLSMTPGDFIYTWGTGPTADSLTVRISAVPEPASFTILALGGMVLFIRRRA